MRKLVTYSLVVAVLGVVLAVSAPVSSHSQLVALHVSAPDQPTKNGTADAAALARRIAGLRHAIVWHRSRTWYWQDRAGVPRAPTSHAERHTRSVAYLGWINGRWNHRQIHARKVAHSRLPNSNDWMTAVRIVQRVWPGTSGWLLSCSGHEGGHGIWVWNGGAPYGAAHSGSDAGGWMQYFSGTWSGNFHHALDAAETNHRRPPASAVGPSGTGWTSPLAQAFAAGWARYEYVRGTYPGPWPWNGDPYCA